VVALVPDAKSDQSAWHHGHPTKIHAAAAHEIGSGHR